MCVRLKQLYIQYSTIVLCCHKRVNHFSKYNTKFSILFIFEMRKSQLQSPDGGKGTKPNTRGLNETASDAEDLQAMMLLGRGRIFGTLHSSFVFIKSALDKRDRNRSPTGFAFKKQLFCRTGGK